MTIRFTAPIAGAMSAGVSDTEDGDGMELTFQCCTYEPDDQDIALGFDTHCVSLQTRAPPMEPSRNEHPVT
ncbi:hypothetical protein [Nonomuraea sp. NPDC050643]|uniref:hypothetical protein n=1 Tax=Nonomuraea sp. NPDC050643 TaxID=3155660 RepID=UPI0033DBBCC9